MQPPRRWCGLRKITRCSVTLAAFCASSHGSLKLVRNYLQPSTFRIVANDVSQYPEVESGQVSLHAPLPLEATQLLALSVPDDQPAIPLLLVALAVASFWFATRSIEEPQDSSKVNDRFWEGVPYAIQGFPVVDRQLMEVPGEQVGDLRFTKLIGTGIGFGIITKVYAARENGSDRMEAVKVIPKQPITNVGVAAGIHKEGQFMQGLNHDNVAKFRRFAHGTENLYLVMELAGERTILDMLADGGRLNSARAKALFQQLADAVLHCHTRGVAHCDIKPANVTVSESGVATLVDFGQAVELDGPRNDRRGTILYAAPEVIAGKEYDPAATDVWSLGVVLLEMLVGANAMLQLLGWEAGPDKNSADDSFRYASDISTFFSQAGALAAWLQAQQALCDDDREAFLELLQGMLAVSPEQRWTSAQISKYAEAMTRVPVLSVT